MPVIYNHISSTDLSHISSTGASGLFYHTGHDGRVEFANPVMGWSYSELSVAEMFGPIKRALLPTAKQNDWFTSALLAVMAPPHF